MKKILAVLLSLVLLLTAVACGTSTETKPEGTEAPKEETTLEKAKRQGYITVGFANEVPYAYATPDGKLSGEAVEVARAVLKKLGINEMNGVLTEFGSLIPGLKAKRFDMITAGMYVKPERCQEVSFANPEYSIGEGLAVTKGNPLNLNSYEDIKNNANAKIAVMGGAIEVDYLKNVGVQESQIVIVPDQPAAIAALQSGRVDATTMTGPSLQAMLEGAGQGIERVMDFTQPVIDGKETRGYGASAFRKDDNTLREAFNTELQKMKESGELLEIISPFGFTAQELPGDMTADQLCGK
jgi:polar amino acid transport system substrate-binding protein